MAINANIPLSVLNPQIQSPTESYGKGLTLRNMMKQQDIQDMQIEQEQLKLDEYKQNAPTRKLQQFNDREMARIKSVVPAAQQTAYFLQNSDVQGASNFLQRRLEELRMENIDPSDTEEALALLQNDPEALLAASLQVVDYGRQMGIINAPAEVKPPDTRERKEGDKIITEQFNPQTGIYEPISEAPRFNRDGGINIDMGGAPGLGSLSTDYGYVLDPETGKPVIDKKTGMPMARPIPGSKAYNDMQSDAEGAENRRDVQIITDMEKSGAIMDATDQIIDLVENSNTPATGTLSRPFSLYSGTTAGRIRSLVGPLKSGVALNAMMRLKNASATGATGFGQLNRAELQLLIDDIGALDPDTTEPDIFLETVGRIKDRYGRIAQDIKQNVSKEKIRELGLEPIMNALDEKKSDGWSIAE